MNSSVYIFGNLSKGYTQYPDEVYSAEVFQKLYSHARATTQIAIHRDGNLMYYAYIRKLDINKYIGMCILLNNTMLTRFGKLFYLFENALSFLVTKGYLVKFDDYGNIVPNTDKLYLKTEEVKLIAESLKEGITNLQKKSFTLPPVNYAVSKESIKEFAIDDPKEDIISSSYNNGYTYIFKEKDYNTAQIDSYKGVLSRVSKERDDYKSACENLASQLSVIKNQKRNIKWVSVLGAIILILGFVIWNKLLFPSEVTNYNAGEFVYYGPLKNKKPHGTGIAIYPDNDEDGRKYYIGNFTEGVRQDTTAMLFYNDGDYFYGKIDGDKLEDGIIYNDSDNCHFEGSFKDDKPYNGVWYDHKVLYKLVKGKKSYR
ncbi:MAG: hypothetical protein IKX36_08655 [Prevotella sp.]|nr:hypothetical protein [Prevotella sp.]